MDLSKIYPPRPSWVHKGNFGSVLAVCGSKLYTGSAAFASIAALRSGADLVTVCAPTRAADVAANTLPDLMTYPLKGDYLSTRNISDILDIAHLRRINSAVIGCGLGRRVTTFGAIHKLISKLNVPMVLDADALRAIAHKPVVVFGKQVVLTPHAGELAILLGQNAPIGTFGMEHEDLRFDSGQVGSEQAFEARLVAAKQAAHKFRAVVLLKGFVDIITDGTITITNNTGSPYMTKGGFGDTLSGIVGALLARGTGLFEAAHAAAYINGKAGEMAAAEKGEGVAASDIFDYLPEVISG